jgi:hypothetical protein
LFALKLFWHTTSVALFCQTFFFLVLFLVGYNRSASVHQAVRVKAPLRIPPSGDDNKSAFVKE